MNQQRTSSEPAVSQQGTQQCTSSEPSRAAQLEPEGPADERRCFEISGRLAKSSAQERLILASSAKKLYNHEHGRRFYTDVPRGLLVFLQKPKAQQLQQDIEKAVETQMSREGLQKKGRSPRIRIQAL